MTEDDRNQRILSEIDRLISTAMAEGQILLAQPSAELIARDFPESGLSLNQIAEEIVRKAVLAGASMEIGERQ